MVTKPVSFYGYGLRLFKTLPLDVTDTSIVTVTERRHKNMLKSVRVDLEEDLLRELDSIVYKLSEISDKGYSACSISRKDLINFAIASTFGLSYPYIPVSRKKMTRAIKEIRKPGV